MAIFSNSNGKKLEANDKRLEVQAIKSEEISIISVQTKLKGEIETNSVLEVDGTVEGDIKGEGTVHISNSGKISGNINAETVFVDGEVNGEIFATKVEIGAKGKVFANITSAKFIIQEGGLFEGNKRMKVALIEKESKKEIKFETEENNKNELL